MLIVGAGERRTSLPEKGGKKEGKKWKTKPGLQADIAAVVNSFYGASFENKILGHGWPFDRVNATARLSTNTKIRKKTNIYEIIILTEGVGNQ